MDANAAFQRVSAPLNAKLMQILVIQFARFMGIFSNIIWRIRGETWKSSPLASLSIENFKVYAIVMGLPKRDIYYTLIRIFKTNQQLKYHLLFMHFPQKCDFVARLNHATRYLPVWLEDFPNPNVKPDGME